MTDLLLPEEIVDPTIDDLALPFRMVREPEQWKDRPALLARLGGVRAVMVRNMTVVDRDFLDAAPDLKVIGRIGVGLDNLDMRAINGRGIVVCYPPEENAVSVAEHVFAMLLALALPITS